ncbi:MAG: DNA glycosylase AlkZ-like family protein, partial [Actinomycetota bacterium]
DPTTMGWFEREWYLGPHKAQLFDTNGNAGPTAWWDGRIVGGWRQRETGDVDLQLLEDVGSDARRALEAEAARLTEWFGGTRVLMRFPSPLSKELAGTEG